MRKSTDYLWDLWDTIKWKNIYIIHMPEEKTEETENWFKKNYNKLPKVGKGDRNPDLGNPKDTK